MIIGFPLARFFVVSIMLSSSALAGESCKEYFKRNNLVDRGECNDCRHKDDVFASSELANSGYPTALYIYDKQ
jgi:hypothetical protein